MTICNISRDNLAVVGLGYVGLPLAVELGKHFKTIGFDVNQKRINNLLQGIDLTKELESEAIKSSIHLTFTSNDSDLKGCDTYIVTVPTPITDDNKPDLSFLIAASSMIGKYLKKGDLVIYESTVYPGVTEEVCVPLLSSISKLEFNTDFFCGYSPERINPGDKNNTITKIKKIVSGSNESACDAVEQIYSSIIQAGIYRAESIKVAEAAKVIENAQRDLNIAFVNELSVIFDKLGIDTLAVLEAAGSKWNFLPFRPGMVGGHCISVDPFYLSYKAEQVGYNPEVILAGRRINERMSKIAARNFLKRLSNLGINHSSSRIGILGITFKENCPDIRNSKVFDLIAELKDWGCEVIVSDDWASEEEVLQEYGIQLAPIESFKNLDGLIIAVGHNQNRTITVEKFKSFFKKDANPLIGDLKSLYDRSFFSSFECTVYRL
jgi:UDP-N-acetyl-D-galactosamine dehydrogenase